MVASLFFSYFNNAWFIWRIEFMISSIQPLSVSFECRNCSCTFKKTLKEIEPDGLGNCFSCSRVCRPTNGTLPRDAMMALVINYLSYQVACLEDRISQLEKADAKF